MRMKKIGITADDMAAHLAISRRQLFRCLKDTMHTTWTQLLTKQRIQYAIQLLSEGISPSTVASACGFSSYNGFAKAFVRDKYRFNQWGRVKIANALRMKCISSACIAEAMEQIDEDEYLDILATLLKKKLGSVKGANDYERNGKLIRFAMGHGYEMNDILMCIKQMGYDNEYME